MSGAPESICHNWMQINGEVFTVCGSCRFFMTGKCLECVNETSLKKRKFPVCYKGSRRFDEEGNVIIEDS